jgi:hypothetical protein
MRLVQTWRSFRGGNFGRLGAELLGDFHNLLQQRDVVSEGLLAVRCERQRGERAVVLEGLGDDDVAGLLKRPHVRGEVAVGHLEQVAQLGEGHLRSRHERGHDAEPSLFVDDAVELEKGFGLHGVGSRFSVK